MPELPEVTTIVNQLKENLTGKIITDVDVRLPKMFQGLRTQVLGLRIDDVRRRAKMIIIDLEGPLSLVIHLKMTGQLIFGADSGKGLEVSYPNPIPFSGNILPSKHTHIIFTFNDNSKLFFNDVRKFGWVKVLNDTEIASVDEKHGPDALGDDFTADVLKKILVNWGRPVKLLLLEQSKIAGIGNIYANEILWESGISPMKQGREVKKTPELYRAIKKVLEKGIKYHGSSAGDEAYVDTNGQPGEMQNHTVVYQKAGQKCPRCKGTITRSVMGGRGTFFCPKCQN